MNQIKQSAFKTFLAVEGVVFCWITNFHKFFPDNFSNGCRRGLPNFFSKKQWTQQHLHLLQCVLAKFLDTSACVCTHTPLCVSHESLGYRLLKTFLLVYCISVNKSDNENALLLTVMPLPRLISWLLELSYTKFFATLLDWNQKLVAMRT